GLLVILEFEAYYKSGQSRNSSRNGNGPRNEIARDCRMSYFEAKMRRNPMHNPILEELWGIREQIMRDHGDDLDSYFAEIEQKWKAAGVEFVGPKPKRIKAGPKPAFKRVT